MPFKSDKQRRYLWSQKPEVARKFAEDEMLGAAPSFNVGDRVIFSDRGTDSHGEITGIHHHALMNDTVYHFLPDSSQHRRKGIWTAASRLRKE